MRRARSRDCCLQCLASPHGPHKVKQHILYIYQGKWSWQVRLAGLVSTKSWVGIEDIQQQVGPVAVLHV